MAIEGISSAVNMNSTPVRKTAPSADSSVATTGTASQLKVDTIRPVEAKDSADGSKSWDEGKQDSSQVQTDKEVSPEKVKNAVDDINRQLKKKVQHTSLSFKYHEETNRISITVKDSDTDEVIREIPPEKTLDMLAKAWELAGLLVDEKR